MNEEHTKNCPSCGATQTYSTRKILLVAIKNKSKCKDCRFDHLKISAEEKKRRKKLNDKKYTKNNKEKIQKYKKEYNRTHKKEQAEYNSRYRDTEKHKANYGKYLKKYRSKKETQERLKTYRKEYSQREQTKENRRLWEKERRKDPTVRMGQSISASMRASMKTNNLSKNKRHWEDLVGYSVQELKVHLEGLFKPGMSWVNYGLYGWHIDHIIPRCSFNYSSTDDIEFKKCWALDNLQPLWALDNLSKGDKIISKKSS